MKNTITLRYAAAVAALCAASTFTSAQAQEGSAPASEADAADEILVTGRLGTVAQRKIDASYSITAIQDEDIRARAIDNLANALQTVPGVWADDSAGVTANNTRVRGIPRGGYESLAVYEDGLPIQHDPGINWINVDQFLRIDETYASIEAVRGGPSSIFAANAPGGLINFIPRQGADTLSGLVKLTTADYGQIRGDLWVGGPLGNDGWRFSIGGYYNKDQGVRDPGPTANNGGQGRVLISKEFARGHLSFGVKYMEDNNFFFDAIPLLRESDGDIVPLPGFNGHDDTLTGVQDGNVLIRTPEGIRDADFNLFNQSSDLQLTIKGDVELDEMTTLRGGFRYRDSKTNRNARGLNSLSTQTAFVTTAIRNAAQSAFGPSTLRFVYNDDGTAYPANANGNGLIGVNTFQSIQNPIEEATALIELGRVFETGIGRHDVKIGAYFTTADWAHDRNDGVGITEVTDNARLLDLIAVNAAGQVVGRVTDNGIQRYESRFAHAIGGYDDIAFYIADEWQVTDQLRIDGGFRWEKIWIKGVSERVRNYNLGDRTTLADDSVSYGSGVFNNFNEAFDDHSYTLGVNWQFMPNAGVFARYTNSYRLPQIGQYRDSSLPIDVRSQSIEQAEGGVKFQNSFGSLYATVFYNSFKDVQFTNTFLDPQFGTRQEVNYGDVRTIGVELEANVRPVSFFELSATGTYQDPKFKNYTYNTAVNGVLVSTSFDDNRPSSMPKVMFSVRPQLRLFDDRLRLLGEWRHEGNKFNDDANVVKLPAFDVFNASVQFDVTEAVTLSVKGNNLSNSLGLGQGGGGQAIPGQYDGNVILARPIFGRNFQGSALFRF
ncbi:outer membrane receptor protein involved in Fe transport [Novosphingobium chloroacetimidivorans]|uniref:Outer membrane receptor protein involved in Fe transport n=1 Tax=Novosphingobium chloroacetimidivorans TaxID=1428314 RepID=A0A7W7NWE9_9SPHN|nr:TonB-dependent receptor [Novosphingobium chloroacetimidivorans]MBB4858349.1 outer membrane receptor protein involved in Fe transport [Novosphingobium chloroacetimidivorans]